MTLPVNLTREASSRKRYSLEEVDVEVTKVVVDTIVTILFSDAVGISAVGAPVTELQNSTYTLVARTKSAVLEQSALRQELRLCTTVG